MRRRRILPAVLALALAATACSGGGADQALPSSTIDGSTTTERPRTTTTTEPPTTTTTVALPAPVPISWEGCGGGFQCAEVTVPVDYLDPSGPTLLVALVRRPAGDPSRRIGTLIMNPGGPGASGVDRVRRGFTISPEVAARFDIVGFDPRGIGRSTPVTCGSAVPAFRATDLDPDTPDEVLALATAARAVADECARTEGPRLGHLGTVEVVHDLEVIRRNLGAPTVSFVGLSYGTLVGQLWADAYPSSVRALVLDGVVNPETEGDASARTQIEAIDGTASDIDEACAAETSCPLTQRGTTVLDAYDQLAAAIESGAASGHEVGPTQLAYAVFSATYGSERWPQLWQALARGLDGDLGGVAEMARWFTSLVEFAPFALVTCLDSDHVAGYTAWERDNRDAAERSPRFGRIAANELLPCAFWPSATFEPHRVSAEGAPPILVIGSTGDTATPYEQAEAVAQHLESARLLTVEIDGHIAIDDSDCTDDAVTRYLVDLALPPTGARC